MRRLCRLLKTVMVVFIVVSCSQNADREILEQKIHRIETSLLPFVSPARMFEPDSVQLANPKQISQRMAHYNVPGVSVAVIHDNRIQWARVYGAMDSKTGEPVTPETIFEAASTSKFITSAIALHFVQEGLLDLDSDINDFLKSWQIPENSFTQKEKVTLRRLLTHQAGLPTTNFDHDEKSGYPALLDVLDGKHPALNKPAVPELVPGTRWQYSNVGYDVIQLLLEDVSGKPFEQIAREIVFNPLGMKQSTFNYPLKTKRKKLEAMPHDAQGVSREPAMHLTALAHGGLMTTPTDLAKFTREIMLSYHGKSEIVLTREMTNRLLTKEFDLSPGLFGIPLSEGLGVFLTGEGPNLMFAHPGSNLPGLNCWLMGWPELSMAVVVMTNGAQGELLAMEIIAAVIHEYIRNTDV